MPQITTEENPSHQVTFSITPRNNNKNVFMKNKYRAFVWVFCTLKLLLLSYARRCLKDPKRILPKRWLMSTLRPPESSHMVPVSALMNDPLSPSKTINGLVIGWWRKMGSITPDGLYKQDKGESGTLIPFPSKVNYSLSSWIFTTNAWV